LAICASFAPKTIPLRAEPGRTPTCDATRASRFELVAAAFDPERTSAILAARTSTSIGPETGFKTIAQTNVRFGSLATALRDQITVIVGHLHVPTIYTDRIFVTNGGLVSYDADRTDIFRRAASYVDRVLRGEKPGDLLFQQPTKYQLAINLKTVKALGLAVPATLLNTADEVIE
jgi:ABC transporter substrate binding protein